MLRSICTFFINRSTLNNLSNRSIQSNQSNQSNQSTLSEKLYQQHARPTYHT